MTNSAKDLGDKVQEAVLEAIRRCDSSDNKNFLVALYQGTQEISYIGYERQQAALIFSPEEGCFKNVDTIQFPVYNPKENKSWMITHVGILTLDGNVVIEKDLTRCIFLESDFDSMNILLRFLPGELNIGVNDKQGA